MGNISFAACGNLGTFSANSVLYTNASGIISTDSSFLYDEISHILTLGVPLAFGSGGTGATTFSQYAVPYSNGSNFIESAPTFEYYYPGNQLVLGDINSGNISPDSPDTRIRLQTVPLNSVNFPPSFDSSAQNFGDGLGSYVNGTPVYYYLWAYRIVEGQEVFSPGYSAGEIDYTDFDSGTLTWNPSSNTDLDGQPFSGYRVYRSQNGGPTSYVDVGFVGTFTDSNSTAWISDDGGPHQPKFDAYIQKYTPSTDATHIYTVMGQSGSFSGHVSGATGYFSSSVGIGYANPTSTLDISDISGDSQPTVTIYRDNASLGAADVLTATFASLVLKNTNGSMQTLLVFTDSTDAVKGGVRTDYPGNFNWHSTGYQAFYTSNSAGYGTAAVALVMVGNQVAISPTSGNSANWVKNNLTVWGNASIGYDANNSAPTNGLLVAGAVGFGVTSPTAYLHLKAGTTAASTGPLKFSSGALLTSVEVGAFEFLTDDLYFTQTTSTNRHAIAWQDNPIPQQVFS